MDVGRIACIDLPALPLQMVLRAHPTWRDLPVAIVESDRPTAKVSWVNEHARNRRVLPGLRFSAARSLAGDLRAATVTESELAELAGEIFTTLLQFSPRVEPGKPGTFYVDANGMVMLWGRLEDWALAIHRRLSGLGFANAVVVGFHRLRTHAIARTRSGAWVLDDPHREAKLAAAVALDRLDLPPRLRDELAGLGITTLGQFLALPAAEMRMRFGAEAELLHRRASEGRWEPLRPRELIEPISETIALEPAESDLARLSFQIKPVLERLLERLAARSMAMSALRLCLRFERVTWPQPPPPPYEHRLEPAAPTLDARQILELVRLRLDATLLPFTIESLVLELEGQHGDAQQIALFRARARRDLDAADRAIARLRAGFGVESVTRAALRPAHLPEARFCWTPSSHVAFPTPARLHVEGDMLPRVRRLWHRPERIPSPPASSPWVIEREWGPVVSLHGPFRASGAWWVREIERDYYYAETGRGRVFWVFFDRPRKRWYLHGLID